MTSTTVRAPRIETERLVLRPAQESDRAGIIELRTDPRVMAHLGGAVRRVDVEREIAVRGLAPEDAPPGSYVIAERERDAFLGTTRLDRRAPERVGHVVDGGGELELSYLLLASAWGDGFAFEATTAVLRSAAAELPDQPVVLVTQSANIRSLRLADRLGFERVQTFEEFGAEQTLAVVALASFAD